MSEGKQPGVRIDPDLWEQFRTDIEARRGAVRGHLQTELENAIRDYLDDSRSPVEQRIDARLGRIERAVGISSTDGGVRTSDSGEHTHAPQSRDVTERPAANAATDKKLAWLAGRVTEETRIRAGEPGTVARAAIANVVKDEYGFRSDTAKRYVGQLVDRFGLREHPDDEYQQLVTEPKYQQILDDRQDDIKERADDRMDELTANT